MFIRYKGNHQLYFYDEKKKWISGKDNGWGLEELWIFTFWVKDQNICYFTCEKDVGPYCNINEYNLNQEYIIETDTRHTYNITLLSILQKAENDGYRYNNQNLYTLFEGPNIRPDSNDILFRDGYEIKKDNKIYLSKYIEDYYPVLAVSSPNFKFDEKKKKYYWDPGLNLGPDPNKKASNLYRAYRQNKNEIPYTLFLKPNCRQWFSDRVVLKTPGTYQCKYDYDTQELIIYDNSGNVIESYTDVPHTITVCCQGAGGGGGKGHPAKYAGWGGAAGGFIAANCFLGRDISTFTIQVGKGGKSDENGQSSYVKINQTVELTSFASEENPTFVPYDYTPHYEYIKLENFLKIEGEGGGTEDRSKNTAGTGLIEAPKTLGYYKEDGSNKPLFILKGLYFKPLFCLKGGGGGQGGYGVTQKSTSGGEAYFASFKNLLAPSVASSDEDIVMRWNTSGCLSLEEVKYSYNKNKSLDSALILDGPSLKEALDTTSLNNTNGIIVYFHSGGYAGSTANVFEPGGGGGGSSLFGSGGQGGVSSHNNGYDGGLGAGGGGGKGGVDVGNGGKGGNGAVWLIW